MMSSSLSVIKLQDLSSARFKCMLKLTLKLLLRLSLESRPDKAPAVAASVASVASVAVNRCAFPDAAAGSADPRGAVGRLSY
jgi:hypothetical protein